MVAGDTDLTITELIARWRDGVTRGTLANWRSKGLGPPWRKIGSQVLYPVDGVAEYERQRTRDGRWWKPGKPPKRPAPVEDIDPFS